MRYRTPKGNVTAAARRRFGDEEGRFPIFDRRSAEAALRLRGHARSEAERQSIIRRAARFAPEAARRAREVDRERRS